MHIGLGRVPVKYRVLTRKNQVLSLVPQTLLFIFLCLFGSNTAMELQEINLIKYLNLHNTTFAGVQQKPGPHYPSPAAFFSGSSRSVYFGRDTRNAVTSLLQSSKEFTFLTSIRQTRQNTGTIFAFSYGKYQSYRYLEIQSSGRQDVIRVHYSPLYENQVWEPGMPGPPDQQVKVETFPLRLADDSWHRLAVIVSGDQIEVLLDCRSVHRRVVTPIDTSFLLPEKIRRQEGDLTLWLGQRNQANFLFKGYLQEAKLVSGHHGFLNQCPNSDSSCPTCGQFKELEDTVSQLQLYIKELNSRLSKAETKISELEDCECSKSCNLKNDQGVKKHNENWTQGCDNCTCNAGEVSCNPIICPAVKCVKPDPPAPGACCWTCKDPCPAQENAIPPLTHGETFVPRKCTLCTCDNGNVKCPWQDPQKCPLLTCPQEEQIYEDKECCPICKESNFCSRGHNCHQWAYCTDGLFKYSCHCNPGFQGNGSHCYDVDECLKIGGTNGHHCPVNHGRCINIEGSYTCECLDGYKMDGSNTTCIPENLCWTNKHPCSQNATCTFSEEGHLCECHKGFLGDGYKCEPLCEVPCQNGGICVSPNTCQCSPGYSGTHCEEDIDECLLGEAVHKCVGDSVCINRVGWFYCSCRQGFASYHNPLDKSTTCLDIDECELQTHTCHQTATCQNTVGGYGCFCGAKSHEQCSTDCVIDGAVRFDGTSWRDGCNTCVCDSGRVSCSPVTCNCSLLGTDRGCCSQCYDKRICLHQDIPGLKYSSGQKWAYHCMQCECMHGETDCWPADCPPLSCAYPIRTQGSCCPSCPGQDRPCGQGTNTSCVHGGLIHQDGDSWQLPDPACTSCQCKDGYIFCTTEPSCSLVGLLHEHPYWEQRQKYFKQNEFDSTGTDTTDLSLQESNTPIPAISEVSALPTTVFIENVTIPQSEHDTVTPPVSTGGTTDKTGNRPTGQKRRRQHRKTDPSRTKTFSFSSKHIQRYILSGDKPKYSDSRNPK